MTTQHLRVCALFAVCFLFACADHRKHAQTFNQYSGPTWADTKFPLTQPLDTLPPDDVIILCEAVAYHYYGDDARRGGCVLEALARTRTTTNDVPTLPVDAGSDAAPGADADAATPEPDAGEPGDAGEVLPVPDAGSEVDTDDAGEVLPVPDAGSEFDAGAHANACERRVETCVSETRDPAERLYSYCQTLSVLPAHCSAKVALAGACLDAYEYERWQAWHTVSCDHPDSRAPEVPAIDSIYECKQLEATCPGFLREMLAPVLASP